MFAILRSKTSAVSLAFGVVLCALSASGKVSAQERFSIGAKATDQEVRAAGSLLLPAQVSKEDMPQDKEVIAFVKNNRRIDFRKIFPSDWEAICFSGEYQQPVSDIKYQLGKYFTACYGVYSKFRDDGLQAITIVWGHTCRVIEIDTSDFFIESQNGTSCYRRENIIEFSFQKSPVGIILAPSE